MAVPTGPKCAQQVTSETAVWAAPMWRPHRAGPGPLLGLQGSSLALEPAQTCPWVPWRGRAALAPGPARLWPRLAPLLVGLMELAPHSVSSGAAAQSTHAVGAFAAGAPRPARQSPHSTCPGLAASSPLLPLPLDPSRASAVCASSSLGTVSLGSLRGSVPTCHALLGT